MTKYWLKINNLMSLISGILLMISMLIISINVFSRYIFNYQIIGIIDFVTLMIPIIVFLPLANTDINKKHIRVELITNIISRNKKIILELFDITIGLILIGGITIAYWSFLLDSININEYLPGLIRFPIWPTKLCMFFGSLLFTIQLILKFINIVIYFKKDEKI